MNHVLNIWAWRTRDRHHSTSGMTILEVLAVMIIMGILTAMAAPGWVAFVNRQRANRAQDQILQALRETQAEARRTRQAKTLTVFANDGGVPQLDVDDPAAGLPPVNLGEGDIKASMLSLRIQETVEGEAVVDEDGVFSIRFGPNGGLDVDERDWNLPIYITVASPADSDTERCVILATLLGATRAGNEEECRP